MKNCFSALFVGFCFFASAQADYNWMPLMQVAVPDSLQSEDAIYLENITTIDLRQYYESSITQFKRIRINTKHGAETFSSREIYQFDGGKVSMRNARIIKPDGTIVKVGNEQMIETRSERKLKFETRHTKRIQMIFPGLEAGDIIDIVYQLDSETPIFSSTFSLEDDLPSLHSRLTLRNSSERQISTYYDEQKSQLSKTSGSAPTLTWDKTNVPKLVNGTFTADPPTATTITFLVGNPTYPLTYGDLYSVDLMNYEPAPGAGSITAEIGTKSVKIGPKDGLDTKISSFIGYFEKSGFKWVPENEVSTKVKTFDYFDRHEINESLFFRYAQTFCNEQKIPYEIGYSRSLLSGPFDPTLVMVHQMTERFLHVIDSAGSPHYLFAPVDPKDFYYLDEIPCYLEENNCIVLRGDNKLLEDAVGKKIPHSSSAENRQVVSIMLKEEGDDFKVKRTDKLGGQFSNLLRDTTDDWLQTLKISSNPLLPNEKKSYYPYEVTYVQDTMYKAASFVSAIDDSLFWFNPSVFIAPYLFYEDESISDMGEYVILPFQQSRKFTFVLNMLKPFRVAEDVKLLNMENSIGKVKVGTQQLTEKSVKLTFEIELKNRYITSKAEKEDLTALLDAVKALQAKRWVFTSKT